MIDITIKTLDSRNHVFSVDNEMTVKQLKERIAEPVNVPADSQRLIYCGRVLIDDKKLSEYDVHGKVIHLVQRAPPTTSESTNSTGHEPPRHQTTRRPLRTIIAQGPRMGMDGGSGNAMYLGAMAFPADLMDAQGISMPQPRHRLSQSRLSVARGMLRRAHYTLLNLENPTHQESPQEINANTEEIGAGLAATAAAFAAVMADTSHVGVQHPPHINIEPSVAEGDMQAEDTEPTPDSNSPEESPTGEDGNANTAGDTSENLRNGRYRFPRPVHMAELISYVREIERRLSPFLERYNELVRNDPVLENPAEAQRLFDQVSKMMHFLSHAYHAISDIMCDFSQPPPRRLRCRPVLIQHSAVLQTGIPIQVNVGASSSANSNNSQTTQPPVNEPAEAATGETNNSTDTTPPATAAAAPTAPAPEETRPQSAGRAPPETANNSGRIGNLGNGNFEFYMDVGQGSITIDSMEATLVTNNGQGNETTITTGPVTSGTFPWGSPPPPEFLQNLMHTLAGHMMGNTSGSSNINSSASPAPASGGGTAPTVIGEASGATNVRSGSTTAQTPQAQATTGGDANVTNSQARGNTSTQPTTSTQTRSTTRPHVHIAPGFQGMGVPGFFDPFLPCNSHHIHGSRRRTESTESSNANANNQSTSQSTGTSTESPSRPSQAEPPSIVNWFSNLIQGLRASTTQGQGPSLFRILPRDVTVFLQGSPPMQNMTTLPIHTTVAELLQSLPDHSYTEGSSLFTDFTMTLARNLRVIDVLNMGTPYSSVLISLRPVLREFIRTRLLGGREGNQAVSEAVNRINTELRPLIESISTHVEIPFREDVDIVATINQLNHTTIPILIRDVLEEDDAQYTRNVPNHCNDYARNLASILLYCCLNGQNGLESIYTILARRIIVGVPAALQNWSVVHIVNQLRAMTNGLDTSSESIQSYLVFRMAEAPSEGTTDQPQAMETEVANESISSSTPQPAAPPVQQALPVPRVLSPISVSPPLPLQQSIAEQIPDQLPDVILGAEHWHNSVPPDWVPIISRDRERQRRQAVQGPLSDTYLSGMPSKRRKVVTSAKPHTNLARVITESMNSALGAAGVACVEPGLSESAGGDTSLRAAYKEQVRSTLAPTLRHHPDFTPEKYPAAAKLFKPK